MMKCHLIDRSEFDFPIPSLTLDGSMNPTFTWKSGGGGSFTHLDFEKEFLANLRMLSMEYDLGAPRAVDMGSILICRILRSVHHAGAVSCIPEGHNLRQLRN